MHDKDLSTLGLGTPIFQPEARSPLILLPNPSNGTRRPIFDAHDPTEYSTLGRPGCRYGQSMGLRIVSSGMKQGKLPAMFFTLASQTRFA